jgi:hypothetical protein
LVEIRTIFHCYENASEVVLVEVGEENHGDG